MKIALGVTGCIAAYKAVEVLRGLQKRGATVQVVMTHNAARFVAPLTFQAISGLPVIGGMFDETDDPEIKHIALGQSIELLIVAPATANALAKFANGIADDFLSTLYISTTAQVLVAPAMNAEMWVHPATQANVRTLRDRGVVFVDPGEGYLACRTVGPGRLAEPDQIVDRAWEVAAGASLPDAPPGTARFQRAPSSPESTPFQRAPLNDLAGEHVLITAGPTYEAIDPVRGITNRSSGKMGYAIAEAALARGAHVTLITGPVALAPPEQANTIRVRSAAEMYRAVMNDLDSATIVVMAAAVADYRPVAAADQKIKKSGSSLTIELERTEDILEAVGRVKGSRVLIGFAAETENVVANARRKLEDKRADLIVANDVSSAEAGFDVETNRVTLISSSGASEWPLLTKREAADRLFDAILKIPAHAA
jgi:phosphopantothenoylcysteine decarboxylase/phosphopantothenate--cysteine ligase